MSVAIRSRPFHPFGSEAAFTCQSEPGAALALVSSPGRTSRSVGERNPTMRTFEAMPILQNGRHELFAQSEDGDDVVAIIVIEIVIRVEIVAR